MGRLAKYTFNKVLGKKNPIRDTLPFSVKPENEESLYSYLVRIALGYGISPGTFVNNYLSEIKGVIGDKDIDLYLNEEHIRKISWKLRLSFEELYSTSLRSLSGILFSKPNVITTTQLVDALSENNTLFLGYGYKVCPACLKEWRMHSKERNKKLLFAIPPLKKFWRVSFYLLCPLHEDLLIDRCPECKNPLNYHKLHDKNFHPSCFRCGLSYYEFPELSCKKFPDIVDSFRDLYDILARGKSTINYGNSQYILESVNYFEILRNFIRVIQRLIRRHGLELLSGTEAEDIVEIIKLYCNALNISYVETLNSLKNQNKKLEYSTIEVKLPVVLLAYKMLRNLPTFLKNLNSSVKINRVIIFKDWTGNIPEFLKNEIEPLL
ncbi:MAG: TniQ family protein [Thermodesulfovibrio sp.]|nr:TniQ family protein [Thermodesulfovibrio sp.]